jgi:hypothetical protein
MLRLAICLSSVLLLTSCGYNRVYVDNDIVPKTIRFTRQYGLSGSHYEELIFTLKDPNLRTHKVPEDVVIRRTDRSDQGEYENDLRGYIFTEYGRHISSSIVRVMPDGRVVETFMLHFEEEVIVDKDLSGR